MNYLVRLTVNEDGDKVSNGDWHLANFLGGSNTILCTSECYNNIGDIASEGAAFAEDKMVARGGVTCDACLTMIAEIKAYRY